MKTLNALLLCIVAFSCSPISKLYVKFGEAQPKLNDEAAKEGVIRLFFDREGQLYPGFRISNRAIKKSDSRLEYLYQRDTGIFHTALRTHNLPTTASTEALQSKLIEESIEEITRASAGKKLVFIIHGFNKHHSKPRKENAVAENAAMRERILNSYPGDSFQFVEIYWDGCSWANATKIQSPFNSIKIWNNAQPAANIVGLELRRIFSRLTNDTTYIISHSLGALVTSAALFNVDNFGIKQADGSYSANPFREGILQQYADTVLYRTPVSQFRVGMLAPATPGTNTFNEFYSRTPDDDKSEQNYHVNVGFNKYDRVLRKFINRPKYHGATTLGALQSEVDAVEKIVDINGRQLFSMTDFSWKIKPKNSKRVKQKQHAFVCYAENQLAILPFLNSVFNR